MDTKSAARFLAAFLLIWMIAPFVEAAAPVHRPLIGDAVLRSSNPVLLTVDVVVHNPNSLPIAGTLTLYVLQANGVPLTVPGGRIVAAPGLSTFRIYIHDEITAVRWVRVTDLSGVL